MQATNPTTKNEPPRGAEFVELGAPTPMTDCRLARCKQPKLTIAPDERAVYAVAFRTGVYQDHDRDEEREALAVLYLTGDGEHAAEKWVLGATPDALERVPRYATVAADALEPTGTHARRFAPLVQQHPEVGE